VGFLSLSVASRRGAPVASRAGANRPPPTRAAAPAPTGAATSTAAPTGGPQQLQSGGATGGTATPAPTTTARPAVQDFAAVADLTDVYFDFDKYDIRPNDAKTLDANATWLQSNPNHLLLI